VKIQRPDGTERVRKIGNDDPSTCNHRFIKYKFKVKPVLIYRERCSKCGEHGPLWLIEKENRTDWTSIPKTLKRIIHVAEEVKDWKKFQLQTVQKILNCGKSTAWSYYAALVTILKIKQGDGQMYIQPRTLKKLVFLFEDLNCESFTWQQVQSKLRTEYGRCSRPTAKRFEAAILRLNSSTKQLFSG